MRDADTSRRKVCASPTSPTFARLFGTAWHSRLHFRQTQHCLEAKVVYAAGGQTILLQKPQASISYRFHSFARSCCICLPCLECVCVGRLHLASSSFFPPTLQPSFPRSRVPVSTLLCGCHCAVQMPLFESLPTDRGLIISSKSSPKTAFSSSDRLILGKMLCWRDT